MIVEYIRYRIAEDRRPAFERAYQEAGEALSASPHCRAYELSHESRNSITTSSASTGTPWKATCRASARARSSGPSS